MRRRWRRLRELMAPGDRRHQFGAQELAKALRRHHARRDGAVLGAGGGAGQVAPALRVFDTDEQERPGSAISGPHLQQAGHVQKIFVHAAIWHVQHGQGLARRSLPARHIDVDAALFAQHGRVDQENVADGQRRGGSGERGQREG